MMLQTLFMSGLLILAGCGELKKPSSPPGPVVHRADAKRMVVPEPTVLTPAETQRKAEALRRDKFGLLYSARVVTDQDAKMLIPPDSLKEFWDAKTQIAQTPPIVEFGVVPATPRFFGESPAQPANSKKAYSREWSNWSQATQDLRTGKFYSTVGDTDPHDAHLYVVEYEPASRTLRCLPEIHQVLGTYKDHFKEGKLHGYLDFYQDRLWLCTYWTLYPEPEENDYASGYQGGRILAIDVTTGDIEDYGVPLKRVSWPYHRVDTRRGIMYGVGFFGEFMAWDINARKLLWGGYPPKELTWWWRAMMIDEQTGKVFSSYIYDPDTNAHMVKYDPAANRFTKLETRMPHSSAQREIVDQNKPAEVDMIRANTLDRGPDGLIWGVTKQGELFTFNPDTEQLKAQGINWPGLVRYTCALERSPGGRYLYYSPGAHGGGWQDGSPIVQYDTKTGTKKVIAFLYPYFQQKYGYILAGTFSIKLDAKGETLFALWNGGFFDPDDAKKPEFHGFFGNCAITAIRIPASERVE